MSDYTDDVLDGLMCEICGVFMGESVGYPRKCQTCNHRNKGNMPKSSRLKPEPKKPRTGNT